MTTEKKEKKQLRKPAGCGIAQMINAKDLEAMAAIGMTPAEVGNFYGCSQQNIVNILKKNPHLKNAFDTGVNRILVKAAKVLIKKLDNDDTLSALFILKCKGRWVEEQYRKEKEVADIPKIHVYLPHNRRDEVVIESE